jgi:hypothetical protein
MRALSLKQLEQLDPQAIEIDDPQHDPMYQDRLLWLLENNPQQTARQFRESLQTLKAELLLNLQQASLALVRLKAQGVPADAAEEKVYAQIVAPPAQSLALSSSPPDPLPENEQAQILAALLN